MVSGYDGSGKRVLIGGTQERPVYGFRWSPDRQLMAYVRGPKPYFARDNTAPPAVAGEFSVVRPDGSLVRVIDRDHATYYACCLDLVWSPDGSRILYWNNADGEVLARIAGGDPAPLPGGHSPQAWSPDGALIALERRDDQSSSILVTDRDGGNAHQVAAEGSRPQWSPDSTRLAYVGMGERVHTVRRDGTGDITLLPQGEAYDGYFRWSPDGRHLLVDREVPRPQTWSVAPDGTEARLLLERDSRPMHSEWLDNATVVTERDGVSLVAAPINGGPLRDLNHGLTNFWVLSPARDWILYRGSYGEEKRLHKLAPSGASDVVLTDGVDGSDLDFSADSSAVATRRYDARSNTSVWAVIPLDGRGGWNFS